MWCHRIENSVICKQKLVIQVSDLENKYSVTISYQSKIIVTCGNPSLIPKMINFSTKSLHTLAKLAESYHILDSTNHSSIPCIYLIPYSLIEPSVTVLSRCKCPVVYAKWSRWRCPRVGRYGSDSSKHLLGISK